jgi:hypothetical protein
MPSFCLFTCAEVHGSINIGLIGEPEEENHVTLRCASDLARDLLTELNRQGFGISRVRNSDHSADPSAALVTSPLPGRRLKSRPEAECADHRLSCELAISADAVGAPVLRAGPGDRRRTQRSAGARGDYGFRRTVARSARAARRLDRCALDRWVLEQLRRGDGAALCHLFEFDSDTPAQRHRRNPQLDRSAGACNGARAEIVDYIPAHHAVTALGFAYFDFSR